MLKIEVDVAYPQYALNDCAGMLALVCQGLTAEDLNDDAKTAMHAALDAVARAMVEMEGFITLHMRGDDGYVRPMVDKRAPAADPPPPAAPRLTARTPARPQAERA